MRHLKEQGIDEIVLALSNLAVPIKECFGNGHHLGVKLVYVVEESALGTAGAFKNASELLTDTFFVLNGDVFSLLDFHSMLEFHKRQNSLVTIATIPVDDPTPFGLVETAPDKRITRFLEKPMPIEVTTNFINAGAYILEPSVLDSIPYDTTYSAEKQLFPNLLANNGRLFAFPSTGYWIDIGNPQKYRDLNFDLLSGQGDCDFHGKQEVIIGDGCQIHPQTKLEGPVLVGDNCVIEEGAVISGPVVIGNNCHVGERAFITDSIIWNETTIATGCRFISSIAATGCELQAGSCAEKAILADYVTLIENFRLTSGSVIEPQQILG